MSSEFLTHVQSGTQIPTMVEVSSKESTLRSATARAYVQFPEKVFNAITQNSGMSHKGPVFSTAVLAATMAVKNTSQIIPLCHSLPIEGCNVSIEFEGNQKIRIECTTKVTGKTGVEMEALVGASIAALTIYDMCKAISHEISIECVQLVAKSGGKSEYHLKGA